MGAAELRGGSFTQLYASLFTNQKAAIVWENVKIMKSINENDDSLLWLQVLGAADGGGAGHNAEVRDDHH